MASRHARLNAVAILSGVVAFSGLELAAMSLYPGGTWWDATTRGHRFWENYLCDLEWRVALNGESNPIGSRFATGAMLVIALALAPFWFAAARVFADVAPRLATKVRVLGITSVAATVAVVFMPSDEFGTLHGAMVVVAGVPGLVAAALAVQGLMRARGARLAGGAGAAMLACATVDFVLYVSHLVGHNERTPLVPGLEKVALLLLLAWMVIVANETARSDAADPRAPGTLSRGSP